METPTLHLQGIGKLYAVPASQIRPFDSLVWNYDRGEEHPVIEIRNPSPQYLTITEKHGGTYYSRKLKRDRLVVVRALSRAYSKAYRQMRADLRHKDYHDDPARFDQLLRDWNGWIDNHNANYSRDVLAGLYGQRDAIRDFIREAHR